MVGPTTLRVLFVTDRCYRNNVRPGQSRLGRHPCGALSQLLVLILLAATALRTVSTSSDTWASKLAGSSAASWFSSIRHSASAGGEASWATYKAHKSKLAGHPDDASLQLETAEALLKWVRHTTNGNFPRAAEGRVGEGDSPASRKLWKKHAPEALRLLKSASAYAQDTRNSYDIAKFRFLHAEASTYLSSSKGILRAALQADAVTFKRNVKPLVEQHPEYQGGVGHTFMGAFYLAAPWPIHDLGKAEFHFDAALKIDPRCRRNHYCRGLVALARGDSARAKTSFKQAVRCKPTSTEEEDVGEFFLRESRGALRVLETHEREGRIHD